MVSKIIPEDFGVFRLATLGGLYFQVPRWANGADDPGWKFYFVLFCFFDSKFVIKVSTIYIQPDSLNSTSFPIMIFFFLARL